MLNVMRGLVGSAAAATIAVALLHMARLLTALGNVEGPPATAIVSLQLAYSTYAVLAAVSALVIAVRAWRTHEARLLALFLVLAAVTFNVFALYDVLSGELFGYSRAADVLTSVTSAFGLAALLRFAVVFAAAEPTPATATASATATPSATATVSATATPSATATVSATATTSAASARASRPGRFGDRVRHRTAQPLFAWLAGAALAALFLTGLLPFTLPTAMVSVVVTAALIVLQLQGGYAVADAHARGRIQWLYAAVAAGGAIVAIDIALLGVYVLSDIELPVPAWDAWLLVIGCMLGLLMILAAVFYRGDIDPSLVIRRSVAVGLVGPLLVFVFAAVEEIATNVIAARLNIDPMVATLVAAGSVALLVGPLRQRVNALYERAAPQRQDSGEQL